MPSLSNSSVHTGYWPKRYTLLALCFLAAFVCYIDRVNISVAAIAMQEQLGWSETVKGLVLSSFFIGYMLFQIPSGYLANRYGGKLVLGFAVAWWSVFTFITPLAALSLPLLIAARIGMGLGEAAMFPGAYSLFGRWVPPVERSRAVALLLSGVPVGTVFALLTSGWIVARFGWPSVFYIFGASGAVWVIIWISRTYNDPADHPRMSVAERTLLLTMRAQETAQEAADSTAAKTVDTKICDTEALNTKSTDTKTADTKTPDTKSSVPWKKLLGSSAVWALIVNHFCSNWGLYMLLAWLPSYFRKALGFSIEYAGLYAAAPWLIMFLTINLSGWIADWMTRRGFGLTFIRKSMQTFGLAGSSLCLLLAGSAASAQVSVLLMCGALGALGFTWSGFLPNHLDIAPRYADILMGITNTAGTVPGIVGVALTGWLVDISGSYNSAFALAAAVNLFGLVIWLLFSTGKRVID
jgi:MFS transporter, ACS family, solute carrier family 17 (sodium-dependent inorganic phosphate cotransporter), other